MATSCRGEFIIQLWWHINVAGTSGHRPVLSSRIVLPNLFRVLEHRENDGICVVYEGRWEETWWCLYGAWFLKIMVFSLFNKW